jgi:hypothetical protein
MVSKCANSKCSAVFRYLGKGRLFRFERTLGTAEPATDDMTSMRKAPTLVEHFWLCDDCARQMTLRLDRNRSVIAVPIGPLSHAAAS